MGILIIGIIIIALIIAKKKIKAVKYSSCILVTGAVKSGKSTFSVNTALKLYRKNHLKWRIQHFFDKTIEEPLLYSNVPLAVEYVPITKDLIERRKRFRYKSVIYIQEATLLADNMAYKDKELNERVMLFNKLIGHSTRGGTLIYDTQATGDLPAVTRRCLAQNIYVHSMIKCLPFILIVKVKEEVYREDSINQNNVDEELKAYRYVIIPKSVWKKYDCYCYSAFTDDLPVEDRTVKTKELKAKEILSYNNYKTINKEVENDKEN